MTKLNVNGKVYELEIEPHETLAEVLRNRLDLRVRVFCQEGECSCCTVLLDGEPVTSCLILAMQAEGKEITTIEGLGDPIIGELHPVQKAFIDHDGLQCGFCTPGMILQAKTLLENNPNPTEQEVKEALSGNLCRCGSYEKIVASVLAAAQAIKGG